MKKILNWIFALLDKVGKDKYQHFTLGAIIASIVYMLCVIVGIRFDMSFITSILVTFILEWTKEFVIDDTGDPKDFAVTMLGGATIGVPILLTYLCF